MRAGKIAAVLTYLLFVVVFVEVSLQAFYYVMAGDFLFRRAAPPLYKAEAFAGYMNKPRLAYDHHTNEFEAHYYINRAGFRVAKPGIEYAIAKPANTYRIMLLGPSFAYGWGVEYEKSFAALLPRLLMKQGFAEGREVEVIDAGIPAMPPATQLNWYEHVGKQYHPDLVIQFIYGSMAVKSDKHSAYGADADGYLVETDLSEGQRWRERMKQFATVFYAWMVWTDLEASLHGNSSTGSDALQGAGRELIQASNFSLDKPNVRDAMRFYDNLAYATRASGARLQVVYFPLSYVIYPEDESRWSHLGLRDVKAQSAFDAAFVNHLNEVHIPAIDITGELRKAAAHGPRLYNWLDIHWTPEGNAAAARAVAHALMHSK